MTVLMTVNTAQVTFPETRFPEKKPKVEKHSQKGLQSLSSQVRA